MDKNWTKPGQNLDICQKVVQILSEPTFYRSTQPIISLKLSNFLAFKKLPGKFIRSRPWHVQDVEERNPGHWERKGEESGTKREGEEDASFPINLSVRWLQEIIFTLLKNNFGKFLFTGSTYQKNGRAADGPPHGGAEEGRGGLVGARRAGRHGARPQVLSTVSYSSLRTGLGRS